MPTLPRASTPHRHDTTPHTKTHHPGPQTNSMNLRSQTTLHNPLHPLIPTHGHCPPPGTYHTKQRRTLLIGRHKPTRSSPPHTVHHDPPTTLRIPANDRTPPGQHTNHAGREPLKVIRKNSCMPAIHIPPCLIRTTSTKACLLKATSFLFLQSLRKRSAHNKHKADSQIRSTTH